ncbi:MAG: endonuclease domain-containing protein [Proteobacteria bacterium]|nr:endonuclease domain-containing protein [Pseudomonadota bacterium]
MKFEEKNLKLARVLRKNMTDAELNLWQALRCRQIGGFRFRRQVSIGSYIADFLCKEKSLIVEVDGSQHFDQATYDKERTRWLEEQGFQVLRFWNNEVMQKLDSVKEVILLACLNN